jgi:hypothetical protein
MSYFFINNNKLGFSSCLAISIFIKPFTLIFIPYLIFKKKYKELLFFIFFTFILFLLPFILLAGEGMAQRYPGPLSPEESMKKLNVAPGFKVSLFASEPHVFDPVSLEFDEEGNAYVIEMPDYPYEVEPGKGHGRIRILKDTDSDGKIDQSIIFAENVTEATSM